MGDCAIGQTSDKMKKLYLTLLLGILLSLSFISADESFIFKQNDPFTFELAMSNNDLSRCTACDCEISIFYPNGSSMVQNDPGINVNGYCRYTATSNVLGIHGGEMYLTNGVDYGRANFEFEITSTGNKSSTSLWIIGIILLLAVIFMILSIFVSEEILLFLSGCLFIVAGIFIMIFGFGDVADFYTRSVSYVAIGIGLLFAIGAYSLKKGEGGYYDD